MTSKKIISGDCVSLIPKLKRKFSFVFADPPRFEDSDLRAMQRYEKFTKAWILACAKTTDGIIAAHVDDLTAELFLINARELELSRLAWITYAFKPLGQSKAVANAKTWRESKRHCLVYSTADSHTWNRDEIAIRTELGRERIPGNVWGLPDGPQFLPVSGGNYERWFKAKDQLPERYLERLIRAYTNPGDWVLDPFSGSGTAAVVAHSLGRPVVAIDSSPVKVEQIAERLDIGAIRV